MVRLERAGFDVHYCTGSLFLIGLLCCPTVAVQGQENFKAPDVIENATPTDPSDHADGSMNEAAKRASEFGPLPADEAERAIKTKITPSRSDNGTSEPNVNLGPKTSSIVQLLSFLGATDSKHTPPDTTGAVGQSSYIQLVNRKMEIFDKVSGTLIGGPFELYSLANVPTDASVFDPQIFWDVPTKRFYYAMDAVYSASDNRIAFGFSKTSFPTNATIDWCHYSSAAHYGTLFPDYPRFGDSQYFEIIGTNVYKSEVSADKGSLFQYSDLIAFKKVPAWTTTCPSNIPLAYHSNLLDSNSARVFSPVPAHQIDPNPFGYVVARTLALNLLTPSNKIWFFTVARDAKTGQPLFGTARAATTENYGIPPNAGQPGGVGTFSLDTGDARMTQAVLATDPFFGTYSFWTQHTIDHLNTTGNYISTVRWYEVDPSQATPKIMNYGEIRKRTDDNYFNGAISPDRTATGKFGNGFIITYNHTSVQFNIYPGIEVVSGRNGSQPNAYDAVPVVEGLSAYEDFSCATNANVCRWGDYAGAAPDPYTTNTTSGVIWATNQFSGDENIETTANWITQIYSVQP